MASSNAPLAQWEIGRTCALGVGWNPASCGVPVERVIHSLGIIPSSRSVCWLLLTSHFQKLDGGDTQPESATDPLATLRRARRSVKR
jgi:hypothetical protein